MHVALALPLAGALGAAGWTLLEYLLHRFVFHGASATRLGAREHRKHHAQVDYFAPWWQKALAALAATALVLPIAVVSTGATTALAFTLGFVAMYGVYEVLHRRAHTHPPRGRYGRWRRRNHFAHHFQDPRLAQGVTSPIWDIVFGTRLAGERCAFACVGKPTPSWVGLLAVDRVRVPRRLAMVWLVDAQGEIWPAYRDDYELVGSAHKDARTRQADSEAAMANRSPEASVPDAANDSR
jgi:hypothetical protein